VWSLRQILDGDGRQVDSLTSNIGHLLSIPKTLGQLQVSGISGRWWRTDVFGSGSVAVHESIDHLERLMV